MNRRLLLSVCFVVFASTAGPSLGVPSPVCVSESGISLCVQFDNLPNTPAEHTEFEVTFDGNIPSVSLKKGHDGSNTLYQWRIWCKLEGTETPADIGTISCPTTIAHDFAVTILDADGGPGARIVKGIDVEPANSPDGTEHYSRILGGSISELRGDLILQGAPGGQWPPGLNDGGNVGSLTIGTIYTADPPPVGPPPPTTYPSLVWIPGGVTYGLLSIGVLSPAVTAVIGPVYPGAELNITRVGQSYYDPIHYTSSALWLANLNETTYSDSSHPGKIHLVELEAGAVVHVGCIPHDPGAEVDDDGCVDDEEAMEMTVDRMDGSTVGGIPGARLNHRGLFGYQGLKWETLNIGVMESGAKVTCGYLVGTLNLKGGIMPGAELPVNSIGYGLPSHPNRGHGIVNLLENPDDPDSQRQPIAGTLQVDGNIAGQIANIGNVTGTISVSGNIEAGAPNGPRGGIQVVGDVLSGGSVHVGDVLGDLSVGGDIKSSGTVTTDEVALGGRVRVFGNLSSSLTVFGSMAGLVEVGTNLSGSLTVAGNVSGQVHVIGDQSGLVDLQSNLSGTVTVDGGLNGTGQINVTGSDSGTISVQHAMENATKIQARSGLGSTALIDVNTQGDSSSTTRGTIWIGGSTTQSPLPALTFLGSVQVNHATSPGTFTGLIKVVGCLSQSPIPCQSTAPFICIEGTNHGEVRYFSLGCNGGGGE